MSSQFGRKQRIIKNGLHATFFSIFSVVLSFITRKVFITTLGTDFLGYEGLFSNIFSILSVAEAGFLSLMYYSLYKEVAYDNYKEISRLMEAHRVFYRTIGIIIASSGILLSFGLSFFISDGSLEMSYVYRIYFIQLLGTVIPYFLSYKRTLFTVKQEAYLFIKIDAYCTFVMYFLKILLLYLTSSYIIYLLVSVTYNIVANIIVSIMYNRRYTFISHEKLQLGYFKEKGLTKDIGNLLIGTIAGKVYFATDSIVIVKMLGIPMAGLYANYFLINQGVDMILQKLTSGLSPAVGNYVHMVDEKQKTDMYKMMKVVYFFVAIFTVNGFLLFFQPVIKNWLGDQYLLPVSLVYAIAANSYITWNHQFISILRGTVGYFEKDRIFYILSAVTNILLSIYLSSIYGITGIVIGTVVGQLFFWMGRALIVHKYVISDSVYGYIVQELLKALYVAMQALILVKIGTVITDSLSGLFLRSIVFMAYTGIQYVTIGFCTVGGRKLIGYFVRMIKDGKIK